MPNYSSLAQLAALSDEQRSYNGDPDEERRTLQAEMDRARDPRVKAVLQAEYDRQFNGGANPPQAASMRDGFPEVTGGAPATVAQAPAGLSLSDFLDSVGKPSAPQSANSRSGAAPMNLSDFLDNLDLSGPPAVPKASLMDRAKDAGLALVQGAIQVPQAAVGLADLVTGGQVGKALENKEGSIGFRPNEATAYLESMKSPAQLAASAKVAAASQGEPGDDQGLLARTLRVGAAALGNPSVIEQAILQSLPSMGAGGVVGRGAIALAPRLGAAASGIGEGVVTMGQQAEQIRTDEHNPSGLLDPTQAALAAGSGAATGMIGAFSNVLAKRLGFETAENLLTGIHANPTAQAGVVKRILGGAVTEGFLEELPQSVQEQVAQNAATGQPLDKDVDQQAVLGVLSGSVMGAGAQAFHKPASLIQDRHSGDPADVERSNQALDDIAAAPDADAAIDAFNRTHIPLKVPQEFDAEGALARMDRANANDENMLHDRQDMQPSVTAPQAPQTVSDEPATVSSVPPPSSSVGEPPAPTDNERMQAKVPETFQDRLAVVREKLEDSRTRQQVRDTSGSQALDDATYMAAQADNDQQPGAQSDKMLTHAERILRQSNVPELPRVTQASQKAQSLAQKRVDTEQQQADKAEQERSKAHQDDADARDRVAMEVALETVAPKAEKTAKGTEKGSSVSGNDEVVSGPSVVDERAHEGATSPNNDRKEPSQAQKEAGNYKHGHDNGETIPGVNLSFENAEGTTRSGIGSDGKPWSNLLKDHYGKILGTNGMDKEHIDAFVKPGTPKGHTGPVFVVDQIHPSTGLPDEHKVMFGYDSLDEAKAAYKRNYHTGWNGLKTISATPLAEFKTWLAEGDTRKPFHSPTLKERAADMAARTALQAAPTLDTKGKPEETVSGGKPVETPVAPEVVHSPEPAEVDLGPTVKHTTGKGKDIFGYVLQDATDKEARSIDQYTFDKDGGKFIRERHADALEAFLKARVGAAKPAGDARSEASKRPEGEGVAVAPAPAVASPAAPGESSAKSVPVADQTAPTASVGKSPKDALSERWNAASTDERKAMLKAVGFGEAASAVEWGDLGFNARVALAKGATVAVKKPVTPQVPNEATGYVLPSFATAGAEKAAKPTLAAHFLNVIQRGEMPKDNPALRKLVEAFDGKAPSQARMKEAQETLEAAIVEQARSIAARNSYGRQAFDSLVKLYESQPLLNVRTSTSIENQAYSTPAPLALLASDLAGITWQTSVLEPTAGTGMLLLKANPAKSHVNELDPFRLGLLQEKGFRVSQKDAATDKLHHAGYKVDRVIANPPFGPLDKKTTVDGYIIGQIDQLIAARALETMKDNGRATLILGANKVAGGVSVQDRTFFNWLYSHYNVTSHFEVDGKLYTRQGASWPVRVITIEGREASTKIGPLEGVIQRADTWEGVYGLYEQGLATGRAGRGLRAGPVSTGTPAADDTRPVREPAGDQAATPDRGEPAPSARSDADVAGKRPRAVVDPGAVSDESVGSTDRLQRPSVDSVQPDAVGRDAGRPGAGKPDGDARAVGLADAENQFQAPYTPRSSRKDTGVLIPINMRQPTQDALSALEDAVGDIDEYARKQLGYATVADLHDAMMGLQVDSVASAIYQMGQEKGTVIADQTGIGKGRQAAAIIRWAAKNGRIPVFMSAKPSLFTDMYGDLHDIGTDDVAPLIMNSGEVIRGEDGAPLFANKGNHKDRLQKVAESGMLPEGRNAIFSTYSQINVDNMQRKALLAIAPRAIFVLDESHNAAGESSTGDYIKSVLDLGKGVVYLSATYAKRPDNMPLYYKTDMGQAVADDQSLITAMELGGLPLQTVVSNNLVRAGQFFRRERSYDGVEILTINDTPNRERHEALSDRVTESLRAINNADRMFHEVFFKSLQKEMKKEGGNALDTAGNQVKQSVDHTEFSSVVHNFVRQMLLALEADNAANRAIAALQRGEKPLIALENTMGSFLDAYVEAKGIKDGESLGDFGYRNVLSRALERSRVLVRVAPNGVKTKQNIPLSRLDPMTLQAYTNAQEVIDGLDIDLPVSPIDWMRHRLTSAGFSVAEITGRTLTVDYTDPKNPKLSAISQQEKKDKVRTTRMFNSGKLDTIILNVSGSTGISLHASEKFTDQRMRKMIVAQAAQDINIFMQMLGRIHRTGQVALPGYELLNADLPAVKRPTAVLSKKMKSLNANTSSNTESATSVKSLDMLNKYGDAVVESYLADNPMLAMQLGLGLTEGTDDEGNGRADLARKATGRIALMPVQVQKEFYADIEAQYETMIDYLNKTNQNELEPRTFDFDARETASQTIFQGTNPASPFGQDAIYNEFSIKAQGKPYTPAQIREQMKEHLGEHKTGQSHALALTGALQQGVERFKAKLTEDQVSKAQVAISLGRSFINEHPIGSMVRVSINDEPYVAVVTNIRSTDKGHGNPFSMSKIQVTIAVNGALRSVTVPASRFSSIETSQVKQGSIEHMFREGPADERQTAKIITGNLLGAYGELKGVRGTIISFSKEDGTIEQGILLPKAFSVDTNTQGDYRLPNGEAATLFLQRSINKDIGRFGIQTRDGIVRVTPDNGAIVIKVPLSKAKGGKYFLDENLRKVTGDFVSSGSSMTATVAYRDAPAALDALMKKQALYTLPSMADEARDIVGTPRPGTAHVQRVSHPDRDAGQQAPVSATAGAMKKGATAAQWLAGNAPQPWARELAARLAPHLDGSTVTYLKSGEKATVPTSIAAAFRRGNFFGMSEVDPISGQSNVYMRYDAQNPVGQEDLLHELLHAATDRALSVSKSAPIRAELDAIRTVLARTFDTVLTHPNANDQARNDAEFFRRTMVDEHEMLAYGLTSSTFRKWAQKLDATGRFLPAVATGTAQPLTLWQRFVDVVRQLLGMSKLYQGRLDAILSQQGAGMRTADAPVTLATRLDALLQQTLDLQVGADEFTAQPYKPRAGTADFMQTMRGMDQEKARNLFLDAVTSHGTTNLWQRTIGTQYAKAEANPTTFKPVFNAVQDYIKDQSVFANAAADEAPGILPKLDSLADAVRNVFRGTPKTDIDAAGRAAFEGTLKWTRDEGGKLRSIDDAQAHADTLTTDQKARELFRANLVSEAELKRWQATPLDIYDGAVRNRYEQHLLTPGVVFSDQELRDLFKATPAQIDLYRQFRAAVDMSLDDLGRTELVRLAGTTGAAVAKQAIAADSMADTAAILSQHIDTLTEGEQSPTQRDAYTDLRNKINDKANQVGKLKSQGYAPLMRFGEHTVHVTEGGETVYFGLYESGMAANKAARSLRDLYPRAEVVQGKMSQEAFKLYQGMDLNALELFAETTGNADNAVYQDFLRLTKNNRSAMKRMIERKGISGFNENTARVLASFVTSNARLASGNLHMGKALSAAAAIPKEMGDLKDEATKLIKYVQSPGEEAAAVRGLLFTSFIGGSVASALVNLTQPFTMSLPYLSQFGGAANAGRHLLAATRAAGGGKVSEAMAKVLKANEDLVSPQEVHHLQSEAMDRMGNHPAAKSALFLWGSMFSLSEQFNRRVTFIAAYQTAMEQGNADPTAFARKAVIETQGLYNKGNKPNWSRGAFGATVMTFKQFSIHYLEFLNRMYHSGPEGKKAVVLALAILMLTAGGGGLPFADDLDDMIDTLAQALGYDFSSKKAKREFIASTLGMGDDMAQLLTRGISGVTGMPIDVSLRMGMGNLLPATGILLKSNTDRARDVLEFAGAAGGLAKNALDAAGMALSGDVLKAGMNVMPLAIQNMAKSADMFNTGEYRNMKGQKVVDVSAVDSAAKFIGFNPATVANESQKEQEIQRSVQLAKNTESEIAAKWAQGLNENDRELQAQARADLADWNDKNPEAPMRITTQQIINRVRQMRASRADRTIKAAPREMRENVREALQ